MKKSRLVLAGLVTLFSSGLYAQNAVADSVKSVAQTIATTTPAPVVVAPAPVVAPPAAEQKVTVYGFVRNDLWFNSRMNVDLRDRVLDMYPADIILDAGSGYTIDQRESPQVGFSAIVTRLGVKFGGVKAFKADVSGVLETDFFGITNGAAPTNTVSSIAAGGGTENLLRLRHAYAQLDWKAGTPKKTSLLIGQYWNPNFVAKCFPGTANFSTGIPFNPFSFIPQIRLTQNLSTEVSFTAMMHGFDLAGFSPSISPSTTGIANGVEATQYANIPSFAAQLTYESKSLLLMGSAEVVNMRPVAVFGTVGGTYQKIAPLYTGVNLMGLLKYTKEKAFTFKAYAIYADNITQYVGLGGMISYRDSTTTDINFITQKQLNLWGEFILTKSASVQPALFVGYAQNLGLSSDLNTATVKKGTILAHGRLLTPTGGRGYKDYFRIAPRVDFLSGKMKFSVEYELSSMIWGNTNSQYLVDKNMNTVNNHRILFLMVYNF